jgi:hypothetical protein
MVAIIRRKAADDGVQVAEGSISRESMKVELRLIYLELRLIYLELRLI